MDTETAVSVVLLEDEPLIAIDIEDQLQSAGFNIVKVLSTCAEALEWLQDHSPDIAILDLERSLRSGCAYAYGSQDPVHYPFGHSTPAP
ncbi:response regulator [Mesorhizobium loti]|uniref:response regulator n=1 Tax=Rhizobium loti TaxID=381 RepID=UPI000686F21D|nr:response regulator [Mesorhizobium loti]